jgi:hypothetical protein
MEIEEFAKKENKNELMFFAYKAENDLSIWKLIQPLGVQHNSFGLGNFTDIFHHNSIEIQLKLKFKNIEEVKKFTKGAFENGFFNFENDIQLPLDVKEIIQIAQTELTAYEEIKREEEERLRIIEEKRLAKQLEEERQKQKEERDKAHFKELKDKYGLSNYKEDSPLSELYLHLLKIEKNDELSDDDIRWFTKKKMFLSLAYYYENRNGDGFWDYVKASKYYRKAEKFTKANEILNKIQPVDNKEKSIIETVRGANFRQIGKIEEAKKCAFQSIEL